MKANPFALLPETVNISGVEYAINGDFRVGVAIETELLQEQADVFGLLDLFYCHAIPKDVEKAAMQMIAFYAEWDQSQSAENKEKENKQQWKKWYDFTQDADVLMASFQQAYGIDLETVKMHWWKFRRLMFGLPPETPFMQRVHFRTADLTKVDKNQRKHYRKMKQLYALKQPERKEKMTAEVHDRQMREHLLKRYREAMKEKKK